MSLVAAVDFRFGDNGRRFRESVSSLLGLKLDQLPNGCMVWANHNFGTARRMWQEKYELDRVILGSGHEITRQHES